MRKLNNQRSGFSVAEVLLCVVIVAILGFTGYFVYHAQKNTNKTLNQTNKTAQSTAATARKKAPAATGFAACKQAAGSKMVETYPEQCVTADGQTFTDSSEAVAPPISSKAPADSPTPAAGNCATTDSAVVTVKLAQGVPEPRCSQVTATQTLSVVNPTDKAVTVTLGGQSITIQAGKTGSIAAPFGDYLQTGDHVMQTGLYGGSGPEIYLPAN